MSLINIFWIACTLGNCLQYGLTVAQKLEAIRHKENERKEDKGRQRKTKRYRERQRKKENDKERKGMTKKDFFNGKDTERQRKTPRRV